MSECFYGVAQHKAWKKYMTNGRYARGTIDLGFSFVVNDNYETMTHIERWENMLYKESDFKYKRKKKWTINFIAQLLFV